MNYIKSVAYSALEWTLPTLYSETINTMENMDLFPEDLEKELEKIDPTGEFYKQVEHANRVDEFSAEILDLPRVVPHPLFLNKHLNCSQKFPVSDFVAELFKMSNFDLNIANGDYNSSLQQTKIQIKEWKYHNKINAGWSCLYLGLASLSLLIVSDRLFFLLLGYRFQSNWGWGILALSFISFVMNTESSYANNRDYYNNYSECIKSLKEYLETRNHFTSIKTVAKARLEDIKHKQAKALCGVAKFAFGGCAKLEPFVKTRDLIKENFDKKSNKFSPALWQVSGLKE